MIRKSDIKDILGSIRQDYPDATEKDIAFAVLCDTYSDKTTAYRLAYGRLYEKAADFYGGGKIQKLLSILSPFGVGPVSEDSITSEENKAALIRQLRDIESLRKSGGIDVDKAIKLASDIRFKLQDKFEMEESQKQKRIIIVPQKHDIICPHTNRECTYMPDKAACMKYYNLKEDKSL